jgi:glycosyltransferase involved in cell wall biosynthesis
VRVVLISGIFPPDIGGPATHASDLRRELVRRGHRVAVLSLHDGGGVVRADGTTRYPRSWPWPLRFAAVVRWLIARRDGFDVVYATGLQPEAVLGARLAGRPVVTKVVGDAAWERGQRRRLTDRSFETFQREGSTDLVVRTMQAVQRAWIRRSSAVIAPSKYLSDVVEGWVGRPADVTVIPNGAVVSERRPPREARNGLSLLFVGRLVAVKQVDRLIQAVQQIGDVTLDVIGEGPSRSYLEGLANRLGVRERVSFRGSCPHEEVIRSMISSDALVLTSDIEGFPHVAVEALASGLPLVAPLAGGLSEIIREGVNAIVLQEISTEEILRALRRIRDEPDLRRLLAEGAERTSRDWRFDRTADRIESLLSVAQCRRPRAIFLGKARAPMAPSASYARKLELLYRELDPSFVHLGDPGFRWHGRVRSIQFPELKPAFLGGILFYTMAPAAALALASGRDKTAIVCQSPFEAVGTLILSKVLPPRLRPPVVVEIHGDWRTATELYGSTSRHSITPIANKAARWSIRSADAVRAISDWTEALARSTGRSGKIDRYPTYSDVTFFREIPVRPLPEDPAALFVGSLSRTKGLDILLQAWPLVVELIPQAQLRVVGEGPLLNPALAQVRSSGLQEKVSFLGALPQSEVRSQIDRAWLLVLPSRSEGMGRVLLEAMARGRPTVGTTVGGIPELVQDGHNGLLVPPHDANALAAALIKVLSDRELAEALGGRGRERAEGIDPVAQFSEGIQRLASWIADA